MSSSLLPPPKQQDDATTTVGSSNTATPKQRKQAAGGAKDKARTNKKTKISPSTTTTTSTTSVEAPLRTLVIDNGGDTLKYGWSAGDGNDAVCRHLPNVTARLPQQWTVLAGDQLTASISNPNQCIAVTRSTERGMITNLGNQVQVWKRLLDLLSIRITSTSHHHHHGNSSRSTTTHLHTHQTTTTESSAAAVFGWKQQAAAACVPSHNCAVLLAVPPFCPRSILDAILTVWFEDFRFARVGFCLAPVVAAVPSKLIVPPKEKDSSNDIPKEGETTVPIACVVDMGWSAIHIVPVYKDKIICQGAEVTTTVRRMPLGARHLINIWKYYCSYRQWNMMDQEEWVLRHVFEQTAYVSLQFEQDMQLARRVAAGRRPYDLEYVLPDYQRTFAGTVQIPQAVQRELEKEKTRQQQEDQDVDEDDEYDEENDEDFEEKDAMEEDIEDDGGAGEVVEEDEEAVPSDEDERPEEIRKRLLQQRAEEEKRRRELEAEQQVLNITVERFAIPEALFRPSDVGLPSEWASLPAAIVQSIEACPAVYRAGLYQSIQLTGGLSQLPNLKERLERELRALAPDKYPIINIRTCSESSPIDQAWNGARKLASDVALTKWSVSRNEWESSSKRGAWKRLLMANGGYLV